ncbi:MAG: glycosyltransferase family 2 protein [Planctomycetota bacterium]
MLVTVVIPSYQQGRYLRAAIDSVLAQDYEPLEVLVLDGGSTDESVSVLESYGDRIWWHSGPDGGQCDAIHRGFERARGDIISWLNSDDYLLPGAIRRAVDALEANPAVGLVYGESTMRDDEGRDHPHSMPTIDFDLWRLVNLGDYIVQPGTFFRRDAYFESGGLDQDLNWALDWDLWIRMAGRRAFLRLDERLGVSRLHDETKTATGAVKRQKEIDRVLRQHGAPWHAPSRLLHKVAGQIHRLFPLKAPLAAANLQKEMPTGLGRLTGAPLRFAERRLRRWMDRRQGMWPDGHVGRHARLWVPSPGAVDRVRLFGSNLALEGQTLSVRSRSGGEAAIDLRSGEPFELSISGEFPAGPIELELRCSKSTRLDAPSDEAARHLGAHVGVRRVGVHLSGAIAGKAS